jgi:hypothetical protein
MTPIFAINAEPNAAINNKDCIVSKTTKFLFVILFILVFTSLGLNIFLMWQLQQARQQALAVAQEVGPAVQETLTQTIADLETLQTSTVEFEVNIDEEFPVAAEIPLDETIDVPIQLAVPIKQNINTTIIIDVLGQGVPVNVTVPIDVDVPIDTMVSVPIKRTVDISTTVPLKLDVPIALDIGDTELAGYPEQVSQALASFDAQLNRILTKLE